LLVIAGDRGASATTQIFSQEGQKDGRSDLGLVKRAEPDDTEEATPAAPRLENPKFSPLLALLIF